jgi:hypothetical protein
MVDGFEDCLFPTSAFAMGIPTEPTSDFNLILLMIIEGYSILNVKVTIWPIYLGKQ